MSASTSSDPLFHCSNLQGVILGVGLAMLEQMFIEKNQDVSDSKDQMTRNNKRRKTNGPASHDIDEDDNLYYAHGSVQGKKAKGGTGYAGDQKEDVGLIGSSSVSVTNPV